MLTALIMACLLAGATMDVAAPESAVVDRDAWQPGIRSVFDQLEILDLFALATKVGGVTVKVPRELQALPMRMIEGADELRERGIEILVKELQFRDLDFIYDKTPQWPEERPLVPTAIAFRTLGVSAEAQTRVGNIPLGATFENGRLPVDFLPMIDKGFDLNLMPENRAEETQLDDVRLQVGGPLATGIANRFFSKHVARLILEHGVGQTLQMGQSDLLAGDSALRLLDLPVESQRGRAVETLLDGLRR